MKKRMIAMVALLMAVVVTGYSVSGTYAKYTTNDTGEDEARVAKFGVTVAASTTDNAFLKTYAADDANSSIANTVVSTAKVVAPGTSGTLATNTITGTPEVAVKVTNEAEITLTGWELEDGSIYCPIVFTVGTTDYAIDTANNETLADFADRVEEAIAGSPVEVAVGDSIADAAAGAVSWKWDFSTSDDNDVNDTYLGDQAADGTASTISISVTTTVTQID